ncbi:ABC transporter permease [Terrilactibacillus laevilacticus]|uniref:ABC transporter permease n=1 Tax=Terrilactibacillus laevilacticus TaxID=1380157 RepID=A0ABW5PNA6_9BACI|nr:ABC transporter permease [Terrilactibacillus laevilacticus]
MSSMLQNFSKNKTALICMIILLFIIVVVIFSEFLPLHSPNKMNKEYRLQGPSSEFFLGTDQFGRDLFSRIISGAKISLLVGISSVIISVGIGIILGLIAGYFGKWYDSLIMRTMDILFAFPEILLALAIVAALGPGTFNTILAIGIVNIPVFTRLVRGSVLGVKNLEYIESAKSLGAKDTRILFLEILPNITAPLLVQSTLAISGAILTESALSFLGLGVQPPNPSWGGMIAESRRYMELAPGMIIWPCLAMLITIFAINLFGDALNDIFNPLRGKN